MKTLKLDKNNYQIKECEYQGYRVQYRSFENNEYVLNPKHDIQKINVYIPEGYYHGEIINGYTKDTAPILVPNGVGGYMPGALLYPDEKPIISKALLNGYVVVSAGIRGRGLKANNEYVGTAPACIVDYKAVIRYIRENKDVILGDSEKIISNGTSAGGALSILLAATGNHPDYEDELIQLGAALQRDDIFMASIYCPITNLDHADIAYEWEFNDLHEYCFTRKKVTSDTLRKDLTQEEINLSLLLKQNFNEYLQDIGISVQELKNYITLKVIESANKYISLGNSIDCDWLTIENNQVVALDWNKYIEYRTRMKRVPSFDSLDINTPENELFGYQHFTDFSYKYSHVHGNLADKNIVKLMNPMYYIHDNNAIKAKHFRINHGSIDRDTSLAISALLAISLKQENIDVIHQYPWDVTHSGDYDLDELFEWIDMNCK